jgi:hypothetical protein
MRGEVSIRPYPLSAHPGYLVDAAVLAAAMTLAGPSKSASFSPNAMEALSAPADAGTMRGAKKWMGLLRMVILGDTTTGSSERAALIREAKKQMSYAMFLFAQNKGLVAYYKDQKKELDSLQDVAQD